jgi:hypothetical protein
MTPRKLASLIAKREGKKSQVYIGNIREIIGIISDILYLEGDYGSTVLELIENGRKREKKRLKNKK